MASSSNLTPLTPTSIVTSPFITLLSLSSSYKDPCDYIGHTQITQIISRSLVTCVKSSLSCKVIQSQFQWLKLEHLWRLFCQTQYPFLYTNWKLLDISVFNSYCSTHLKWPPEPSFPPKYLFVASCSFIWLKASWKSRCYVLLTYYCILQSP